jgi:DNA-binding transcriptional LysR family regulator
LAERALIDTAVAYFVEVAERGSFTSAARALSVSQPSLSVAVKKLEEELGTPLLHRGARGVSPTRAGELLLARAREASRALRAAREEIGALGTEPVGAFLLGCHESLGTYVLPGFMARFLASHSRIELSLFNATSREVELAIVERRVDLGLVVNPGGHPDTVVRPLFEDRVCFVAATELTRGGDAGVSKKEKSKAAEVLLARHPLFHVPAIRQTQALLAELASRGTSVHRGVACSSMELVKSLVLDGAGIGILPYRVATHGVAEGKLEVLSPFLPRFDDRITLVWRADAPETAGLRSLIDALLAHGRAMPALPPALR